MSFFKGFATGFLKQVAEDITSTSEKVDEYVKADYVTNLEEAKKRREERREERKKAKNAVATLKNLGIEDDTAIANILDQNGYEGTAAIADRLQTAVIEKGVTIDPETFILAIKDENLTIDDAFKRLEGDLKYIESDVPVRADGDKSFWERTFGMDYRGSAERELEEAFGEDAESLAREAKGEYVFDTPTGGVTLDWSQLREDKGLDNLSAGQVESAHNAFLGEIVRTLDLEASWDPEKNDYIGKDVRTEKFDMASALAAESVTIYNSLISAYGGNVARARQEAMRIMKDSLSRGVPDPKPEPTPEPTPDTSTTATTTTAVDPNVEATEYANIRARDLAIDTLNPDQKRKAIAQIQKELRETYGLNTTQINQIVTGL